MLQMKQHDDISGENDLSFIPLSSNLILVEQTPEQIICRICYDSNISNLIKPCNCSGSSAFTHEECLKLWILEKYGGEYSDTIKCEICKQPYAIEIRTKHICKALFSTSNDDSYYHKMVALGICLLFFIIFTSLIFKYYINYSSSTVTSIIVSIVCFISLCTISALMIYTTVKTCCIKRIKYLKVNTTSSQTHSHSIQN